MTDQTEHRILRGGDEGGDGGRPRVQAVVEVLYHNSISPSAPSLTVPLARQTVESWLRQPQWELSRTLLSIQSHACLFYGALVLGNSVTKFKSTLQGEEEQIEALEALLYQTLIRIPSSNLASSSSPIMIPFRKLCLAFFDFCFEFGRDEGIFRLGGSDNLGSNNLTPLPLLFKLEFLKCLGQELARRKADHLPINGEHLKHYIQLILSIIGTFTSIQTFASGNMLDRERIVDCLSPWACLMDLETVVLIMPWLMETFHHLLTQNPDADFSILVDSFISLIQNKGNSSNLGRMLLPWILNHIVPQFHTYRKDLDDDDGRIMSIALLLVEFTSTFISLIFPISPSNQALWEVVLEITRLNPSIFSYIWVELFEHLQALDEGYENGLFTLPPSDNVSTLWQLCNALLNLVISSCIMPDSNDSLDLALSSLLHAATDTVKEFRFQTDELVEHLYHLLRQSMLSSLVSEVLSVYSLAQLSVAPTNVYFSFRKGEVCLFLLSLLVSERADLSEILSRQWSQIDIAHPPFQKSLCRFMSLKTRWYCSHETLIPDAIAFFIKSMRTNESRAVACVSLASFCQELTIPLPAEQIDLLFSCFEQLSQIEEVGLEVKSSMVSALGFGLKGLSQAQVVQILLRFQNATRVAFQHACSSGGIELTEAQVEVALQNVDLLKTFGRCCAQLPCFNDPRQTTDFELKSDAEQTGFLHDAFALLGKCSRHYSESFLGDICSWISVSSAIIAWPDDVVVRGLLESFEQYPYACLLEALLPFAASPFLNAYMGPMTAFMTALVQQDMSAKSDLILAFLHLYNGWFVASCRHLSSSFPLGYTPVLLIKDMIIPCLLSSDRFLLEGVMITISKRFKHSTADLSSMPPNQAVYVHEIQAVGPMMLFHLIIALFHTAPFSYVQVLAGQAFPPFSRHPLLPAWIASVTAHIQSMQGSIEPELYGDLVAFCRGVLTSRKIGDWTSGAKRMGTKWRSLPFALPTTMNLMMSGVQNGSFPS